MPKLSHETTPVQREILPGWSQWQWADGTALTQEEVSGLGLRNAGNWGNFFEDVASELGFIPKVIDPEAPGASLDTTAADEPRDQLQGQIAALQQQAATGDGAWQQSFADAVRRTQANVSAMGQSNPGTDYQSALRNIGNAQGAAAQRAVGQEQTLRAQSQLDARNQLGGILGQQAQMDLGESAEQARIERERRAANQASIDQTAENRKNTEQAIAGLFGFGGAAGMGLSDGGRVPGRPRVFGDDARNDTVPAMLSPGEIVVPISKAKNPDAAARFARAVAQRGGAGGYAEGGGVRNATQEEKGGAGVEALNVFLPHVGRNIMYKNLRDKAGAGGGGSIDLKRFDRTTAHQDALASLFAGQAAGQGPSVTLPMLQRASDETLETAMATQANGRRGSDVMQAAAKSGAETAGDVGRQRAIETSQGQNAFARTVQQQRGQQLQAASAQQQAGWAKTLADMGLSLKQQAELRGAIGAAGQAAAAFSAAGKGGYTANPDNLTALSNNPYPEKPSGSDPGEWNDPYEQGSDIKTGLAYGGIVGMAKGGSVEGRYPDMPKPKDRGDVRVELGDLELETRAQRKAREYAEETGDEVPAPKRKAPTEKESAFARAVRGASEFMRKGAASVRGMAEGGYVYQPAFAAPGGFSVAFPPGQEPFDPAAFPARRDRGPQTVTGAELGLGGGFSPQAKVSMPAPDTSMPAGMKPAPAPQSTLVQVGESGGMPVVEERSVVMQPKIPGLRLAEPPTPAVAPVAAPAEKPKGGIGSSRPSDDKAQQMERDAARAGYAATQAQSKAAAEGAAAEASAIESQINERKALEARVQERVTSARTKFEKAQEEAARIDATVDPGRFWATRTTGDKVLGIIGLVLGAAGAGPDGINRAAVMLNQAVDRDMDAQKSEFEARLKKAGVRVNAAQSFYSMAREAAGDELGAMDLGHSMAMKAVGANIRKLMTQTNDAAAKAQLAQLLAGIEMGGVERDQKGWDAAANRALEREKIAATAAKGAGVDKERLHTADEVRERSNTIRRNIAIAKDIIRRKGTYELLGTEQTELERALQDVAQDSARLKDPNSTVKDQELANAKKAIGVEGGEILKLRNDTALKLLDSYEQSISDRENEALRVRGFK